MNRQQRAEFNRHNIEEFRASGGSLAAFGDAPVLLLTSVGAKTGQPRTSPMMYLDDEDNPDRVFVFASAAGADEHPAWFRNLVAHPSEVTVELGSERLPAEASVLDEPERGRIFAVQAQRYPGFADYQAKTTRRIPVVALTLQRGNS